MSRTIAVIPARFASQRLPGKPLLDSTGKPLIVHVAERAAAARSIDRVIVAADDDRILAAVRRAGHQAVMTRADHENGTTRVAEVAASLEHDFHWIINLQGDEPLIEPDHIDALVHRLQRGPEPMATLASPFAPGEDCADPNIVKVVLDQHSRALYFSRSLIPFPRDGAAHAPPPLKHVGLYGFRRDFLPLYIALPPTPAERTEKLEQLRVLEHGHAIGVAVATVLHHGIDTPEQYHRFVEWWRTHSQTPPPPR